MGNNVDESRTPSIGRLYTDAGLIGEISEPTLVKLREACKYQMPDLNDLLPRPPQTLFGYPVEISDDIPEGTIQLRDEKGRIVAEWRGLGQTGSDADRRLVD